MAKAKKPEVKSTTSDFKVLETVYFAPAELFVDKDSRGRPAANQDDIDTALAISLYKHGQEQPVNVYRDGVDQKPVIIGGHTRRRAGLKIVEGFEAVDPDTGKKTKFFNPDFKLRADVIEVKDKADAFLKGLVDNVFRSKLTPVQQALGQQSLRDEFGYNDTTIAGLYGYSNTNRVAQLKKLLKLEENVVDAVHDDRLSLSIAADVLFDLKPEERAKAIIAATNADTGEIEGAKVKDFVRELEASKPSRGKGGKASEEEDEDDGDTNANLKRNVKNLRTFSAGLKQDDKPNQNAIDLFAKLEKWFDGKIGDRALLNAIDEYVK